MKCYKGRSSSVGKVTSTLLFNACIRLQTPKFTALAVCSVDAAPPPQLSGLSSSWHAQGPLAHASPYWPSPLWHARPPYRCPLVLVLLPSRSVRAYVPRGGLRRRRSPRVRYQPCRRQWTKTIRTQTDWPPVNESQRPWILDSRMILPDCQLATHLWLYSRARVSRFSSHYLGSAPVTSSCPRDNDLAIKRRL